jgi:hypothetical protein
MNEARRIGAIVKGDQLAALSLLNSDAVRTRAHRLLALAREDELPHFRIDPTRLDATADLVVETTRAAYPSLDVPFHSRWRHFEFQGADRWALISAASKGMDERARARAAFDLAIISVLLDAGAGPDWRYLDQVSGQAVGRSEGLALASLAMFSEGAFSADPNDPLRADGHVLQNLWPEQIRRGLQITAANPMVGLDGRIDLLRRLGHVVSENPQVFGRRDSPRPGGLFDRLADTAQDGAIRAPSILAELLIHLGGAWPSRLVLGSVPLGDCWRHPLLTTSDATNGLVPLHKLAHWMAYSLIEPLQWAGFRVTEINGLAGLAEYRNGGLFVDTGVLGLRDPAEGLREHDVSSVLVVEWRALTVALLDALAEKLRQQLEVSAESFPLAKVLQGGTWATGRKLAEQLRPNGTPPIRVVSDGTVF